MPYIPDGKVISLRYGLISEYEARVKNGYRLRPAEMGVCFTSDNKLDSIYVGNTENSKDVATKVYPAPVPGRYKTELLAQSNGSYTAASNTDLILGKLTNQILLSDKPDNLQYSNFQCTANSPTTKDCLANGYTASSLWINSKNNNVYVCTYSTERAAFWVNITNSLKAAATNYLEISTPGAVISPTIQTKITNTSTTNITLASPFTATTKKYNVLYSGAWSSLIWNTNIIWSNEPPAEGIYNISILQYDDIYLGSVQTYQ